MANLKNLLLPDLEKMSTEELIAKVQETRNSRRLMGRKVAVKKTTAKTKSPKSLAAKLTPTQRRILLEEMQKEDEDA